MSFNVAAWFLLIGFAAFVATNSFDAAPLRKPSELASKDAVSRQIAAIQFSQKVSIAALVLMAPAVFQGFYLLSSGYDFNFSGADPGDLGRASARGRGRGGLVLLVIQFFPYFLIGGYGYLGWLVFDGFRLQEKRIRSLRSTYSYLAEMTPPELNGLEHGLSAAMKDHPGEIGNPEFFVELISKRLIEGRSDR